MKKSVSHIIRNLIFASTIITILIFNKEITRFIVNTFIYNKDVSVIIERNEYSKMQDYSFIQITDDYTAKDFDHLIDIFYTMLDSGKDEFFFYCGDEYVNCQDDIFNHIINSNKENYLTYINNFVHPYNSYKTIHVTANDFGKITVTVSKQYSDEKIAYVNGEIAKIKEEIITEEMTNRQKILAFHDYIINATTYDKERADNMNNPEFKDSITHTAFGLFETNKALCGGFSDTMAIFLFQLGINNLNISSENHVWNLVNIDDAWYHLDVTWDNPVTNTGGTFLLYDYFLITTTKLVTLPHEHDFNPNVYVEATEH